MHMQEGWMQLLNMSSVKYCFAIFVRLTSVILSPPYHLKVVSRTDSHVPTSMSVTGSLPERGEREAELIFISVIHGRRSGHAHTDAIDLGISLLIVFAFGAGGCRPVCPSLSLSSRSNILP